MMEQLIGIGSINTYGLDNVLMDIINLLYYYKIFKYKKKININWIGISLPIKKYYQKFITMVMNLLLMEILELLNSKINVIALMIILEQNN